MYIIKKFYLQFLLFLKNLFNKEENNRIQNSKNASVNSSIFNKKFKNDANIEEIKKDVYRISQKIVKKYYGNFENTVKIIEKKNIKVYKFFLAVKLLRTVGEKQGFIIPLKGFKAFYLNFLLSLFCEGKLNFSTTTKEMFVFPNSKVDFTFFASEVYRFVAYRKNLPGFDFETQEKFKKIYNKPSAKQINTLTAGEIYAIKEAIARDVEAADFALNLSQEMQLKNSLEISGK